MNKYHHINCINSSIKKYIYIGNKINKTLEYIDKIIIKIRLNSYITKDDIIYFHSNYMLFKNLAISTENKLKIYCQNYLNCVFNCDNYDNFDNCDNFDKDKIKINVIKNEYKKLYKYYTNLMKSKIIDYYF
jgi:hypothetical protein